MSAIPTRTARSCAACGPGRCSPPARCCSPRWRLPTMFATVLRGLRARALLSAGSVLLTSLAIGSAVLGPIFQEAVTNSYLVTRLNEAPNQLTGLSWVYQPSGGTASEPGRGAGAGPGRGGRRGRAVRAADDRARERPVRRARGHRRLLATEDACAHLTVEGACPEQPGEVLMLAGDLDRNLLEIGDEVEVGRADRHGHGRRHLPGAVRPRATSGSTSRSSPACPRFETAAGIVMPYQPAPFVTVPEAFAELPSSAWHVDVARLLVAPPDLTLDDLDTALATATTLEEERAVEVEGGRLRGDTVNDLELISTETRAQQEIARSSIGPAVISLVLVAMALLLRLLMAAADLRLPELSLASLRGLGRRQMWGLGLSEPLALLALAVPVGAVARRRDGPGPGPLVAGARTAAAAAGGVGRVRAGRGRRARSLVAVLAVGAGAPGLAVRAAHRRTPSEGVGSRRDHHPARPGRHRRRRAGQQAVRRRPGPARRHRPGPAGAAGRRGRASRRPGPRPRLATWWTRRRRRTKSLPGFVAARAISRRQEGTLVILPVTAAIAVCVFGAGVYDSAASWRTSVAATTAPGGRGLELAAPAQRDGRADPRARPRGRAT